MYEYHSLTLLKRIIATGQTGLTVLSDRNAGRDTHAGDEAGAAPPHPDHAFRIRASAVHVLGREEIERAAAGYT